MGSPISELRWPRWITWVLALSALLLLYQLGVRLIAEAIGFLKPVLVPLLISLAVSYLLKPLVELFEQQLKWSRQRAAFAGVLLAGFIFLFLLTVLVPPIVSQLITSAQKVPESFRSATSALHPVMSQLEQRYPAVYASLVQRISEYLQDPAHLTDPLFNSVTRGLRRVVDLGSNLLYMILVPLFIYYILADFDRLRAMAEPLVPDRFRDQTFELIGRVDQVTSAFVRGQLLVASILSLLYVTGFLIVGVRLPLSLGLLAGFGYLVPYVGSLLAVALTGLFTLLNNPSWWSVIGVIVVYVIIHLLEGLVITPRLLGGRLRLHPMLIITGLIVGGSNFGVPGIVLATPALAILKVLLNAVIEPYRKSSFFTATTDGSVRTVRHK